MHFLFLYEIKIPQIEFQLNSYFQNPAYDQIILKTTVLFQSQAQSILRWEPAWEHQIL